MKAKELYEKLFGDFQKWLDEQGIGDHFSMDVKMSKTWDELYKIYLDSFKAQKRKGEILAQMSIEQLETALKIKKANSKELSKNEKETVN